MYAYFLFHYSSAFSSYIFNLLFSLPLYHHYLNYLIQQTCFLRTKNITSYILLTQRTPKIQELHILDMLPCTTLAEAFDMFIMPPKCTGKQARKVVKVSKQHGTAYFFMVANVSAQITRVLIITTICKNYTSHKQDALDTFTYWHLTLFLNTHTGQQFGYFLLHKGYYFENTVSQQIHPGDQFSEISLR